MNSGYYRYRLFVCILHTGAYNNYCGFCIVRTNNYFIFRRHFGRFLETSCPQIFTECLLLTSAYNSVYYRKFVVNIVPCFHWILHAKSFQRIVSIRFDKTWFIDLNVLVKSKNSNVVILLRA